MNMSQYEKLIRRNRIIKTIKWSIISIIGIVLVAFILWSAIGTSENLDYVKHRADSAFNQAGYEVIGYLGYKLGWTAPFAYEYGGACVYYRVRTIGDDSGKTFKAYLYRWSDEIHIYNIKQIEAAVIVESNK